MTEERALFTEMRRLSPKVTGGIMRARNATYADGAVAGKYKLLTALSISIAIRCESCIRAYLKMAVARGITREELVEFLNVSITMQGCPGEEWSIKAYAYYKKIAGGELNTTKEEGCCLH